MCGGRRRMVVMLLFSAAAAASARACLDDVSCANSVKARIPQRRVVCTPAHDFTCAHWRPPVTECTGRGNAWTCAALPSGQVYEQILIVCEPRDGVDHHRLRTRETLGTAPEEEAACSLVYRAYPAARLRPSDMPSLHLTAGLLTAGRRAQPVAQLLCTGRRAACPSSVLCTLSRGAGDGTWFCLTHPRARISLTCEGYSAQNDTHHVLPNSCGATVMAPPLSPLEGVTLLTRLFMGGILAIFMAGLCHGPHAAWGIVCGLAVQYMLPDAAEGDLDWVRASMSHR